MIRALHRWPGVLALLLVTVLALSGAALSAFPAAERIVAPQAEAGLSVATLAARIQAVHPGMEQIRRAPSGRITAYWFGQGAPNAAVIDPATGRGVASADPDPLLGWITTLHRSLFLDEQGRIPRQCGRSASSDGSRRVARS
jgi:sulfite reductase (NADPH) flavoprotein alpha-component